MTRLEIERDWKIIKGKMQQQWANLTEEDLVRADGGQEVWLGRIQKRSRETGEVAKEAGKFDERTE